MRKLIVLRPLRQWWPWRWRRVAVATARRRRRLRANGQSGQVETPGKVFTAQELSQFDGKDGRPAYVAVDGVVYDVTGSSMWPQGSHSSCPGSVAGRDLSEVMKTAPERMRANLRRFPVVGTLPVGRPRGGRDEGFRQARLPGRHAGGRPGRAGRAAAGPGRFGYGLHLRPVDRPAPAGPLRPDPALLQRGDRRGPAPLQRGLPAAQGLRRRTTSPAWPPSCWPWGTACW